MSTERPIACILSPGKYHDRLSWISALAHDALQSHHREGSTLRLVYEAKATEWVKDLVQRERACCSFLSFAVREVDMTVELTITAPVTKEAEASFLLEPFVPTHIEMPTSI